LPWCASAAVLGSIGIAVKNYQRHFRRAIAIEITFYVIFAHLERSMTVDFVTLVSGCVRRRSSS
jgi:hypothetical protein